jgi:hypothetical protein
MKARYSFYLSPEATRLLRQAGMQNGASRSGIADEAIKAFLSPKPENALEPVIVRRLNSHSKALGGLQRDLAIVTETLGLFVRYFLIVTPPVPESEQEEAKILGRDRFHRFVAQVGRRLGSDQRLISQVLETIVTEKPELFADTIEEAEEEGEVSDDAGPDDDDGGEARGE